MSRIAHTTEEREFNARKGNELRVWRESLRIDQSALAAAMCISASALSRIERGECALTLYRWHLASAYLSGFAGKS